MEKKIYVFFGIITFLGFIIIFPLALIMQLRQGISYLVALLIGLFIAAVAWIWGNKREKDLKTIFRNAGYVVEKSRDVLDFIKNDPYIHYQNGGTAIAEFIARKNGMTVYDLNLYDIGTNAIRKYLMFEIVLSNNSPQLIIAVEPKLLPRRWNMLHQVKQLKSDNMEITAYSELRQIEQCDVLATKLLDNAAIIANLVRAKLSLQVYHDNILRGYSQRTLNQVILRDIENILLQVKILIER